MADSITLTTVSPLVGQTFVANPASQNKVELELIEASALPGHGSEPRQYPFSLVFRAAKDCGLWQGTVQLEHAAIGTTDLFLVPVGEDGKGMYFQALFN